MNWLPIINLIFSFIGLYTGVYLLYWTVIGEGQVICEITRADELLYVFGTFFCAADHYIFSAEFLNTYFALQKTIEGLEISCSDFVNRNNHLTHNRPFPIITNKEISEQELLKERMETHMK